MQCSLPHEPSVQCQRLCAWFHSCLTTRGSPASEPACSRTTHVMWSGARFMQSGAGAPLCSSCNRLLWACIPISCESNLPENLCLVRSLQPQHQQLHDPSHSDKQASHPIPPPMSRVGWLHLKGPQTLQAVTTAALMQLNNAMKCSTPGEECEESGSVKVPQSRHKPHTAERVCKQRHPLSAQSNAENLLAAPEDVEVLQTVTRDADDGTPQARDLLCGTASTACSAASSELPLSPW